MMILNYRENSESEWKKFTYGKDENKIKPGMQVEVLINVVDKNGAVVGLSNIYDVTKENE